MDKLKAYQVLGLEYDASTEEVKEAYARLSKEYHPEENPEEFQQIHEAYVTLTRGGRRVNRSTVVESSPIKKNTMPEHRKSSFIFHEIEEVQEEMDSLDFDFDESISQAESDEIKRLKIVIGQAEAEIKNLLASSNY